MNNINILATYWSFYEFLFTHDHWSPHSSTSPEAPWGRSCLATCTLRQFRRDQEDPMSKKKERKLVISKLWASWCCSPGKLAESAWLCSFPVGGRCARDVAYQRWDCTSRKPFIHGLQKAPHRLSLNKVSGMSLRGRETKAETRNDHAVREEKEVPGKRGVWASGLGRQPTLLPTHPELCRGHQDPDC